MILKILSTHGMQSKHKYVRLVRRCFNGRMRYFAQIVCEGTPWTKSKNISRKGVVGLDIGPQTIAIVAPHAKMVSLKIFADELRVNKKQRKKLQQKMARGLRIGNPDAFRADEWIKKDKHLQRKHGTYVKGKSLQTRSQGYKKNQTKLADLSRREAAHRKTQHGRLANEILRQGSTIKTGRMALRRSRRRGVKNPT